MALILCIETATTNCSVAIGKEGKLVALKEDYNSSYSHAERLHIFIENILKENRLSVEDLDAVAVSQGPGSYTGLRIGVSTAKGFCFAADKPLISVPTLNSLAHQVSEVACDYIFPLLDARRMEVYTTGFNSKKEKLSETEAKILDKSSFMEFLEKGKVCFIGNGVEKFKEICFHPNAVFIEGKLPSATEMVKLAEKEFQNENFEDVAYFEPFYLKDFMIG